MTGGAGLRAAAAAGVLGAPAGHHALLGGIVEVARAIFRAKASSILLLDEDAGELVFEAVAGEGEERLLGMRFPAGVGVAGWVLAARQPLALEDVGRDPRFAREVAVETGYVPDALMAAPLLHGEDALGVLEVLDGPPGSRFGIREMELIALFASQAGMAVDLLRRARHAEAVLEGSGAAATVLGRLAAALDGLDGERRDRAVRLLDALADVL